MNNRRRVAKIALPLIGLMLIAITVAVLAADDDARPDNSPDAAILEQWAESAQLVHEIMAVHRGNAGVNRPLEYVYRWSRRWMDAQLAAAGEDKAMRRKAIEAHRSRMQRLYNDTSATKRSGGILGFNPADVPAAKYFLLEAELMLKR